MSLRLRIGFLLFLLLTPLAPIANEPFPYRSHYQDLDIISLSELRRQFDVSVLVDVRSSLEFSTLHIVNAVHIPLSNMGFVSSVQLLIQAFPEKQIVVYCNGHTCEKSYQAAQKLVQKGTHSKVFDGGVFDWVSEYPQLSVLMGESPVDAKNMISNADFQRHQLDVDAFVVASRSAHLIDIRDHFQRTLRHDMKNSRTIPIDRMLRILKSGLFKDKPLYIMDAVGRQVRWLQFHLEKEGYTKYYFLKGGVRALYNTDIPSSSGN